MQPQAGAILVVLVVVSSMGSVLLYRTVSDAEIVPLRRQKLLVLGLIRQARDYRDFYRQNVLLQTSPSGEHFDVYVSLVSGDSTDGTNEWLQEWKAADPLHVAAEVVDGKPGSWRERVNLWAHLVNVAINNGLRLCSDCESVLFSETDVSLALDTVKLLLEAKVNVIAPWVLYGGEFYDRWGFRTLVPGKKAEDLRGGIHEMESVGTVVLMQREVLDGPRATRFRGCQAGQEPGVGGLDHVCGALFRGFCADVRAKGFRVFASPEIVVVHPKRLLRQRYMLKKVSTRCCREGVHSQRCALDNSHLAKIAMQLRVLCPKQSLSAKEGYLEIRGICFPHVMLEKDTVKRMTDALCAGYFECSGEVTLHGLDYSLEICITPRGSTSSTPSPRY
jgi:hypothetical protein